MNKLLITLISILTVTVFIAILPTEAEGKIYSDTLRLHIIANSDSEEDQELKLKIRDLLLQKYSAVLKSEDSINSAIAKTRSNLQEIENDVETWISELGYSYSSSVVLSEEWYDTREYSDFTLPCGYYTSLRIYIGNGDGRNWWCVMYPPMCLDLATDSDTDDAVMNYTKEEIFLITEKKYNYKLKILELISSAFS